MIVVYVAVKTKDNAASEFERIIREIQIDVRKMTGCVKQEYFRDPDTAGRFVVYGEFDTHDNFEKYLKSSVVERIGSDLIPLLEAPPEFRHYEAVILDGSSYG